MKVTGSQLRRLKSLLNELLETNAGRGLETVDASVNPFLRGYASDIELMSGFLCHHRQEQLQGSPVSFAEWVDGVEFVDVLGDCRGELYRVRRGYLVVRKNFGKACLHFAGYLLKRQKW
jgi:hypothetical protein